jgi:cytochrome c oxidase cbb3-type subunit 3
VTERDRLLGHAADNDGIDEYDNQLPGWWTGLFFFTVVWGIGYAVDYHLVSHRSQALAYEQEMRSAAERWPAIAPAPIAFDAATVDAGRGLFVTNCASCHGADGQGAIGPSLVDATWIHGSEPEQVRTTITNGVAAKGMPSWGPILGPDKVAKLTAHVVTAARSAIGTNQALASSGTGSAPVAAAPPEPQTGEGIYRQNCVPCHGENLQGLVGPSLVDDQWIHGNTLEDITRTITAGVPEKGMVSWGPILGPEKIAIVAAYIHEQGAP